MTRRYRLPNRNETLDVDEYGRVWEAFAEPLRAALGAELHSFDPGVAFTVDGQHVQFPGWVVELLNSALAKARP